jgi:hypothetical protein
MKTQSIDTNPKTERMLIEMLRNAPVYKRFRLVQALTRSAWWSNIHAWQENHHESGEQEAAVHLVSSTCEVALAQSVQTALARCEDWHVQPADLLTILHSLLHLFDELRIPYYLGGSLASSIYGIPQMAQDIDLVVDLREQVLSSLPVLSRSGYVFHEEAVRRAYQKQTAFSLIHLDSLMKIDVVPSKQSAFDTAIRPLVTHHRLDEHAPPFRVASAAEMILFKLHRHQQRELSRTDGMHDDAEWNDILGMLKVQGPNLDRTFLERWAATLAITHTCKQALVDAGLQDARG